MTEQVKTCPFCGTAAAFLKKESARAAEGEAPMRALGCNNEGCSIRPQTPWRDTQQWKQGVGYYDVSYDKVAISEWNRRLADL
jgi:hypothetical protein